MSDRDGTLKQLARKAGWTAFRLRANDALQRVCLLLPLPLAYAAGALAFIKVARPDAPVERTLVLLGAVPLAVLLAGAMHAGLRRRPRLAGALALDRHHGLKDRLTNALTFAARPPAERSPFMEAAIDDGLAVAGDLSPRRAAPIRLPGDLPVAVLLGVAVLGIAQLEVQTRRLIEPEPRSFEPMALAADDLELFRDMAAELEQASQDPEVLAAVRRFNQLVEDIAAERVERAEVFRRLAELERELSEANAAEDVALDQGLAGVARELQKSELGRKAGRALDEQRLADAEEALRKLAETLRQSKDKQVDKKRLEELRRSLEAASKASTRRMEKLEAERKELAEARRRLLKKKEQGQLTPGEQRELDRLERRLERLNREKGQAEASREQLSELDRDLARAAENLMKDLGLSAEDLERSAQGLNRAARRKMSQKEKEELKQKLEELREVLRQQGKGGRQRVVRLQQFGQRARGGGKPGEGKPGEGKPGEGQGQGGKPRPGGSGQGEETLVIGPGGQGAPIPMPGGGGVVPGAGSPQPGGDPATGGGPGGTEHGQGHDPNVRGDSTEIRGQTRDVAAAGIDSGEGASTSQVIYGAADRGFAGKGYRKVYADYETVAEQVVNRDEIPPGYRFYVKRYFQLIRPRE